MACTVKHALRFIARGRLTGERTPSQRAHDRKYFLPDISLAFINRV
jgi:hypothetical protein